MGRYCFYGLKRGILNNINYGGWLWIKVQENMKFVWCRHVKRGQIEDFIKETGTTELKAVCTAMNIGNVCGACREIIDEIIQESKNA